MTFPLPTYLAFAALAAMAAASDVATGRIPNWMSIPLLAGGLAAQAALGPRAVLSGLAATLIVSVVLLPVWGTRRLGGGDLKLAAAAAAWVGLGGLPTYLLASALAGGALATASYAASSGVARVAILQNLRTAARLAPFSAPLASDGQRVHVAAGAAFAIGAAWTLVRG